MIHMHPKSPVSAQRILFVCDGDASTAESALEACHRLCDALASVGMQPLILQNWPATARTETRQAAKVQERPYPVYCSRSVEADAPLLCLVEQPALAITLGVNPIGLAQPLLNSAVPCIAWFIDSSGFQWLPGGALDRRLGLAAATHALATQLSVLTGTPVSALLPPLSHPTQFSHGGDAVLIPSIRPVDGIQRVLQMARARPHIPFVAIAQGCQTTAEPSALSGAPSNVTVLDASRAMRTHFRMAVLPSLGANLPWDRLAHCLAAHIPMLVSSEPLLEDAIGDAGMVVSTSRPLEAWLDALDQMTQDGIANAAMAQAAGERSSTLRLPTPLAAQQCEQLAARHIKLSGHLLTGRI